MQRIIDLYPLIFCCLAGALSSLALPPFFFWWIFYFSIPSVFLLINRKKRSFFYGFFFSFFYFLIGFYWVGRALVIYDPAIGIFGYSASFIIALGSSCYAGLAIWLASQFSNVRARAFFFVIFWSLSEYARGVWINHFPWNIIGYCWANDKYLSLLASVFGMYGIGALLLISVMLVYLACEEHSFHWLGLSALIVGICFLLGGYLLRSGFYSERTVMIRLVPGNVSESFKGNPKNWQYIYQRYLFLSKYKRSKNVSLIIWPETAIPIALRNNLIIRQNIASIIPENGYLITGSVEQLRGFGFFNALIVLNSKGHIVGEYNKVHLVPFGEYVPGPSFLKKFFPFHFVAGSKWSTTLNLPGLFVIGPLICYESIFPYNSFSLMPDVLINITNDAWYQSRAERVQHFFQAGMRAIETGIPLIRVANQGMSGIFYPNGTYVSSVEKDVVDMPIILMKKRTIYQHYHNLAFWLLLCTILLIALFFYFYAKQDLHSLESKY